MIISFFDNEQNRQAINDLNSDQHRVVSNFPAFKFDDSNKLTLISLNADGFFQNLIAPKILVEKLLKSGLPDSIKEVEILVSDIDKDHPLLDYGMQFGRELLAHKREVTIKVPINDDGQTLIVPPKNKGDNWQIFMIQTPPGKQQTSNFDSYYSLSNSLIFEGKLEEFLQEDKCIITSKEITSSAQRAEISENPFYQPF